MATNTDHLKLAKRYASALFELANDHKKKPEVAQDLVALQNMLTSSETLAATLTNPTLNQHTVANAVAALAKKAKLHAITTDFLNVLAFNKRLGLLSSIVTQFEALDRAAKGEKVVRITSASTLSSKQKSAISKSLGGKINLEESVDKALLAGFTLQSGSRMLDASLKGKIDRMKLHLISN